MSRDAPDPRRNAVRDDLADARLKERVVRPRYADPVRRVVRAAVARCHPSPRSPAVDTEFLHGEPLDVFETGDGVAWVQSAVDGYVGYVALDDLAEPGPAPTHLAAVPRAVVYAEPTIKRGVAGALPLGAAVHVTGTVEEGETFAQVARIGPGGRAAYVLTKHLRPANAAPGTFVALAELFVGAPYVWGGKTWEGLDCSGLVQIALQAAGHPAPRDSDMQAGELGEALPDDAPLARGDLIFWRGHVGLMVDGVRLLHASGHHMLTVIEPLGQTIRRLASLGLAVTARRRLAPTAPVEPLVHGRVLPEGGPDA